MATARKRPYLPQTMISHMHYDGKKLHPWLISRTVVKTDSNGKEFEVTEQVRRENGHLIVMKTNRRGERTLIEQYGHEVPIELAVNLQAKVKHCKYPKES